MKKVLPMILILIAAVCLLSIATFADGEATAIISISKDDYTDFKKKVESAATGSVISLESDITFTADAKDTIEVAGEKTITIDLHGHSVNCNNYRFVIVRNGATFILMDSSASTSTNFKVDDSGRWLKDDSGSQTVTGGIIYCANANAGQVNEHENEGGCVFVEAGGTFTMQGGSIVGGSAASNGGGVYNLGTFHMQGGSILGCVTNGSGAGILNNGTLTIGVANVSYNIAKITDGSTISKGGGICSYNHTVTLTGSTVANNKADEGAGIYNGSGSTLSIGSDSGSATNTSIVSNTATANGGGIYNAGTLTTTSAGISGNKAIEGAGILNNGTLTMNSSVISGNGDTTTTKGGGICAYNGTVTLNSCTVSNNKATDGAGIFRRNIVLKIDVDITSDTYTSITGNTASSKGGGIYIETDGSYVSNYPSNIKNATISSNSAAEGAGIYITAANLVLTNVTISQNAASSKGGGIYGYVSWINLVNGTISGNSASQGGGIYFDGLRLDITGTKISSNTASSDGSGLYLSSDESSVTIINATISNSISSNTDMHDIYCNTDSLTVGGTTNITGLFLAERKTINIDDETPLQSGASIKVCFHDFNQDYVGAHYEYSRQITKSGQCAGACYIGVCSDVRFNQVRKGNGVNFWQAYCDNNCIEIFGAEVNNAKKSLTISSAKGASFTAAGWSTAIAYAQNNNDSLTVNTNITLNETVNVAAGKTLTISFSSKSLKGSNDSSNPKTMFNIAENATLILNNATIGGTSASSYWYGAFASVNSGATLTANNCTIQYIKNSSGNGGAINNNGTANLSNCTIQYCEANNGGAIHNNGTATLNNSCKIQNCKAENGGAIYNQGTATLNTCTIQNCEAVDGGALYSTDGASVAVSGAASSLNNNSATQNGGACYITGGSLLSFEAGGADIAQNTAGGNGGALYISGNSTAAIDKVYLYENKATSGAAVYAIGESGESGESKPSVTLSNLAYAMEPLGSSTSTNTDNTIKNGDYYFDTANLTLDNYWLETTSATEYCVYLKDAVLTMKNSTINTGRWSPRSSYAVNQNGVYATGTSAINYSGTASIASKDYGIYIDGGTTVVDDVSSETSGTLTVQNNTGTSATSYGIYLASGEATLKGNVKTSGLAYGLYLNDGTLNIQDKADISGTAYGLYFNEGTLNLSGEIQMKASGDASGLYIVGDSDTCKLNSKLTGDASYIDVAFPETDPAWSSKKFGETSQTNVFAETGTNMQRLDYSYYSDEAQYYHTDKTGYGIHMIFGDIYIDNDPDNSGMSLTLDGTIGVNFYVDLNYYLGQEADWRAGYPHSFVRLTYSDADQTTKQADTFLLKDRANYATCDIIYKFTCKATPAQMNDPIKVQLFAAATGGKILVYEETTTIAEWCQSVIAEYTKEEYTENAEKQAFVTLCKSLLDYGIASQTLFNYNTENMINSGNYYNLASYDAAVLEKLQSVNFINVSSQYPDFKIKGLSFMAQSDSSLRIYYSGTDPEILTCYFLKNGRSHYFKTTVNTTAKYIEVSGEESSDVPGIPAYLLAERFEVQFAKKSESYSPAYIEACGLSYAKLALSKSSSLPESTINFCKALVLYNAASVSYFDLLEVES